MKKINQKQTKSNTIKTIILATITCLILFLLLFFKDIFNINKNNINLAENTEPSTELTPANAPKLSAGMIPIKQDGENWVITTKENSDWYDYSSGKPAYIMLNDGTYQSELIPDMNGKKLASDVVGNDAHVVPPDQLGSIYMWIPRFEINDKTNEVKYVQDVNSADDGFTIPDLFSYKQTEETKPDFLLTGIWLEEDIDTNYSSKITQMNSEESIYGFLAHTKATQITTDDINSIQTFVGAGLASVRDPILNNLESPNRIILKIINTNNQDPIKANGSYNKETGLITVQVTYSQYGISKILLQNTTELAFTKENGIIKADTTGIDLEDGDNIISILDNKGNKKDLKIKVMGYIYATLYTDGTLAFGKSENPIPTKTVSVKYGDISGKKYYPQTVPWAKNKNNIVTIDIVNKISPEYVENWFYECKNLQTIKNINNLNTKNITNMGGMFSHCSNLTELDLSSFNTSNVINMSNMFSNCTSLINLNVSNFDTSKVTNMSYMFYLCSNLTSIDLSSFKTSNVTDMGAMFWSCYKLEKVNVGKFDTSNVTNMSTMFLRCNNLNELDVSNFNTSKVTSMSYMFDSCSKLTNLDVSGFDTSNVTMMSGMFEYCSGLTNLDVSRFDTSNVTNMAWMFGGCSGLTSLNLNSFDTSNVTSMSYMFFNCKGLTNLDLSNFNTSNVTDMSYMFAQLGEIADLDLSNFNTIKVTTMKGMFRHSYDIENINLSNFDTSSVTNMCEMFSYCKNLKQLKLNNVNTTNVTTTEAMFKNCETLTNLDLSNFDTSSVTTMYQMFENCYNLKELDLSSFDTKKVTTMQYMFRTCRNLTYIYVGNNWSTANAYTLNMFDNCGTSTVTRK